MCPRIHARTYAHRHTDIDMRTDTHTVTHTDQTPGASELELL
jgi:hypothetical protein